MCIGWYGVYDATQTGEPPVLVFIETVPMFTLVVLLFGVITLGYRAINKQREEESPAYCVGRLSQPDRNGKSYRYFQLIEDGEHQGKYAPLLSPYSTRKDVVNMARIDEMRDIMESGFEVIVIDPKGS